MKVHGIPTGVGLVPLALALAVLSAGCAATPTTAGLPLAQRAASHRAALAVYQHGAQYQGIYRLDGTGVSLAMPLHCEQVIQSEEDLARGYAAMAQEHRRLARPDTNAS